MWLASRGLVAPDLGQLPLSEIFVIAPCLRNWTKTPVLSQICEMWCMYLRHIRLFKLLAIYVCRLTTQCQPRCTVRIHKPSRAMNAFQSNEKTPRSRAVIGTYTGRRHSRVTPVSNSVVAIRRAMKIQTTAVLLPSLAVNCCPWGKSRILNL
jgi:hypothetical protein